MQKPRFVAEITLGNLIQTGAFISSISIAVGGAYLSLKGELGAQNTRISVLEAQIIARLEADTHWRNRVEQYMRDQTSGISRIAENIVELRLQMAKQTEAK